MTRLVIFRNYRPPLKLNQAAQSVDSFNIQIQNISVKQNRAFTLFQNPSDRLTACVCSLPRLTDFSAASDVRCAPDKLRDDNQAERKGGREAISHQQATANMSCSKTLFLVTLCTQTMLSVLVFMCRDPGDATSKVSCCVQTSYCFKNRDFDAIVKVPVALPLKMSLT